MEHDPIFDRENSEPIVRPNRKLLSLRDEVVTAKDSRPGKSEALATWQAPIFEKATTRKMERVAACLFLDADA